MSYIQLNSTNYNEIVEKTISHINEYERYSEGNKSWSFCPMFFDTETSDTKGYESVKRGKKSEYGVESFVYISQLKVGKYDIYSRDIKMMCELLTDITLGLDVNVNVGIHNEGFDWAFIKSYILELSDKKDIDYSYILSEPTKPITVSFISKERRLKNSLTKGQEPVGMLRLVDTMLIFNMSLDNASKEYSKDSDYPKNAHNKLVGKLDYRKIRTPETPLTDIELDYSMYDVIVGSELMEYIYNKYVRNGEKFPITSTSVPRGRLKKNYADYLANPDINSTFWQCSPKNVKVLKDGTKKVSVNFVKYFPYSYDVYVEHFIKYLFRGGLTHGNVWYMGEVVDNVTGIDYTSSYPASMQLYEYPMTPFRKVDKEEMDKLCNGKEIAVFKSDGTKENIWEQRYNYIFKAKFYGVTSTTYHSIESVSKCIESEEEGKEWERNHVVVDNGRIRSANYMTVWLTELDYHNYTRAYEWSDVELIEIAKSVKGRLPSYLLDTFVIPYKLKAKLKKAGLPYAHVKAVVNSVYGMIVQRLNLESFMLEQVDDGVWLSGNASVSEQIKERIRNKVSKEGFKVAEKVIDEILRPCEIEKLKKTIIRNGREVTEEVYDFDKMEEKYPLVREKLREKYLESAYYNEKSQRILNPYWGLYVTAYSRHHLIQDLFDIEDVSPNCVVYYDTDSLYIKDIDKVRHIIDKKNADIEEMIKATTNEEELYDLGQFEYDPTALKFKHLGAKRYIKLTPDKKSGELKVTSTIAGLKKNWFGREFRIAKARYGFDNAVDMVFNKSFNVQKTINKMLTGKTSSTYFNEKPHMVSVTDYLGNTSEVEVRSGVVLDNIPFELAVSSLFIQLHEYLKA